MDSSPVRVPEARRVVLKLGSQIVIGPDGRVARSRLESILRGCAELWERGCELLIVTSGAVGLGRTMTSRVTDDSLVAKQAYAAIGQAQLIETYRELLAAHGISVAQVLLTSENFGRRAQYLRVRDTLEKLIDIRVLPLINENDTVSTEELASSGHSQSFGDNDVLSALVAAKTDADLLVILTDVDGIYDANPASNPNARRLSTLPDLAALSEINSDGKSGLGRGGIRSKVEAAKIASICGVTTWITSGLVERPLSRLVGEADADVGTVVLPQSRLAQRKQWIAFSSGYRGTATINAGAERAIRANRGSLLPVGITRVEGSFSRGDTVCIRCEDGSELGRGVAELNSVDLRRVIGLRSEQVEAELGLGREVRFVHRNHLVVFGGNSDA